MEYEAVIGLEVHAELQTQTKMFCACPVVDLTTAAPNTAVCPVCTGMPGALPVINRQAVEYALRVALGLECQVQTTSIFARKNYFYPDLPKGYQISQYEQPLAQFGRVTIDTPAGEKLIRVRRVHMEEDTGKLTHVAAEDDSRGYSLVDLNRAGVALLEIVSEPDMNSPEEASAYANALRDLVRCLGVNSGDMEKGVIRFEANVSVRPAGEHELGTRVEIKNLNTFRGMEKAIRFEIDRQIHRLDAGLSVAQETLGWDELNQRTYIQRSKEEAHDYRYFPEPDLPPLVVSPQWSAEIQANLPELPRARLQRLQQTYGLSTDETRQIGAELEIASFFEAAAASDMQVAPRLITNWVTGPLFAWMNQSGQTILELAISPHQFVQLLRYLQDGTINQMTARNILAEMLNTGNSAADIIRSHGYQLLSDAGYLASLIESVLNENPLPLAEYIAGKETLSNWFFGQVMRKAGGQADPQILRSALQNSLEQRKKSSL